MPNKEKKSWIVRVECIVEKEIVTGDCTEEEARAKPYDHVESESECEQKDWKVIAVEPNE